MNPSLRLVLLSAALSAGCTAPLKATAPEGWPTLQIIERLNVSAAEVSAACDTKDTIAACSRINLCTATCTQHFRAGQDTPAIREHENAHCAGRDHWFSTVLADLFARWKRGEECAGGVSKKDHDASSAAFTLILLF
jgi:hypothetical protein